MPGRHTRLIIVAGLALLFGCEQAPSERAAGGADPAAAPAHDPRLCAALAAQTSTLSKRVARAAALAGGVGPQARRADVDATAAQIEAQTAALQWAQYGCPPRAPLLNSEAYADRAAWCAGLVAATMVGFASEEAFESARRACDIDAWPDLRADGSCCVAD